VCKRQRKREGVRLKPIIMICCSGRMYTCLCVCVRARVFVCVYVRGRERGGLFEAKCLDMLQRKNSSVYMYVCVCACVCVCVRERERGRERGNILEYMCVCVCVKER